MLRNEIFIKQIFFVSAWVISSILQAIGLAGFAVILGIAEIGMNIPFIFCVLLALVFSPLVDVIMIEGKRNNSLSGIKYFLAVYGGGCLSVLLSVLSVYVLVALKFPVWNDFAWASFAVFFIVQIVILGVELLFLDDSLNEFFKGKRDGKKQQYVKDKKEIFELAEVFNISDFAADKLDLLAQIIDQQGERNAQTFAEIFQILAGMRGQISVIENKPMPKLSAPSKLQLPNPNDEEAIAEFYTMLTTLLKGERAINKTGLADAIGLSKSALERAIK